MKFIEDIRKQLGLNHNQMAKLMGLPDGRAYRNFEGSISKVSIENLVILQEVSGLSYSKFMKMMKRDVKNKLSQK